MHKCVSMAASRVKLTLTNITHQDLYNYYTTLQQSDFSQVQLDTWPSYLCSTVYSFSELPQYLKQDLEKVAAEIGNWEAMCMYTKLFSMDFVTL